MLMLMDVDGLKVINDTFGHREGDRVICSVAQTVKTHFRASDIVGRFGGDEFVLLFGDRSEDQLRDILQHVLQRVREIRLDSMPDIRVAVSIGGVHPSQMGDQEANYKNMLRVADDRLYQAKEAGRNRCVVQ